MPKRSNEYQKLLLLLNQHLASSGATVSESKMLWEQASEQDREIDIVIEDKHGPYDIVIGIECTTIKRKVGVPLLSSIYEKHKNVGIHRTIVISKFGFTKSALEYANNRDIEAISFDAAFNKEWPSYLEGLRDLWSVSISHQLEDIRISYRPDDPEKFEIRKSISILMSDGSKKDVGEYILERFQQNVPPEISKMGFGYTVSVPIDWDFEPPVDLIDVNGQFAK